MSKTLFEKICDREIPADIVYEDEYCVAFKDINPQAPFHVQLVPRKPITMLASASPEDQALLGHLLLTAPKIDRKRVVSGRSVSDSVDLGGRRILKKKQISKRKDSNID